MYARLRLVLFVLVAFLTPTTGSTQQTNARAVPAAGPRLGDLVTGYRVTEQRVDSVFSAQRQRQNVGRPVALMIVGGAAVVLGALIGGDVGLLFMIGGAVALLIGLYRYLQ